MIDLKSQLIPLIQKDPIVSTFDSRSVTDHPEEVITVYSQHAATYVKFDAFLDLERRFIDKIVNNLTPKACLVAHYGYGKTTVAIGLWQACCQAHILAVPPVGYTSIAEIATTVYSWARNTLRSNTDALTKLRELYTTYLESSTEELAKLVSRRSGRPYEQVIAVLTDPALEGSLKLDPPTTNIVLFLEALTHIVTANGYAGVAVFVDEFQQLLGKAGAEVLTALRSLIWGLRTRKIPFGLILTMDPHSERILGERAGDILHRIKDDDLYIDFRQVHNPEFPKLLWERYGQQLGLDGLTFRIVDEPTLNALGQICDRTDLSNGPRTVANAFRRIASYYADTGKTYIPLQLIDDFLTGAIIFDGDANTIASLVTEFAGYAYFKYTDTHLAVLKLLAAFPAGCPEEIAKRYDLLESFKQITSDLRGDIVTLLPSGYALIELQRVGKPQNKLNLILKKYWMQITNTGDEAIEDVRRFATYIFRLLFPGGSSQAETWNTEVDLALTTDNSFSQIVVGRLHSHHPLRRIRICACIEEPPLPSSRYEEMVDINLIFVIQNDSEKEQRALKLQDNSLLFFLNLGRSPVAGLPPDLRVVEHNLSPQPSTPAVLLNVLEFVEREIAGISLTQSEQVKVNHTLENMRRWLLNFIFDEHLFGSIDSEAASPGYRGMRDLLFRECERRFPHYNTLITSNIWKDNLAVYRKALSERTLAERRGIEPVEASKAQIAALFEQRNHAGFDSKIRVQYPSLLEVTWAGEQGTLFFTLHPLETKVLTFLVDEGRFLKEIVELCRADGYALEEIEEIFSLLAIRGYTKEDAGKLYKVDTISASEFRRLSKELVAELQVLKEILASGDLLKAIDTAQQLIEMDVDIDAVREQAHARLVSLMERMSVLRTQYRRRFIEFLEQQRSDIVTLLRSLDRIIPAFTIEVSFRNHLEGARKVLEERKISLQRSGVRLRDAIQTLRSKVTDLPDAEISSFLVHTTALQQHKEALDALQIEVERYLHNVELLGRWVNWSASFVRLRQNVANLVGSLEQSAPISGHMTQRLDEIEISVREQLAQQGLITLQNINEAQQSLDEVARDYDRNLLEREQAFEQEKRELETALFSATGKKERLRGKYQISKHNESYEDLSLEVIRSAQEALRSLAARARRLEIQIDSLKKQAGQKTFTAEHKTIKNLIRKMTQKEEDLSLQKEEALETAKCKNLLQEVIQMKEQIDDIERSVPIHAMLPLATSTLLSKLTSYPQDVEKVIDIEAAIALLPPESELAALLKLSLDHKIILRVWPTDDTL